MIRILFVDDEQDVLEGLKRVLRPQAEQWKMFFAISGESALEKLKETPFDVVVSDMRMPSMNGAELLNKVAEEFPRIIRIVLSGQSERQLVLSCSESTHQFLYKPCPPEVLIDTISRALRLRDLLTSERLLDIASGIKGLPSLPTYYAKISELLQKEDVTIKEISETISSDISMAAKILQLANSAAFTTRTKVTNIETAIQLLGTDNLKSMILLAEVFSYFDNKTVQGFDLERLWSHSANVGKRAMELAKQAEITQSIRDDAFAAGILHDIGKLVLVSRLPLVYSEALQKHREEGITLWSAEREFVGASHAEIGAYLLGLWGLPATIVEALAYHNEPWESGGSQLSPLAFVSAANVIENREEFGDAYVFNVEEMKNYLSEFGLGEKIDLENNIADHR